MVKDRITRRKFIEASGISIAGANLANLVGRDGSYVEIVTQRTTVNGESKPAVTKFVPRSWYQHLKRVEKVNQKIKKQLNKREGVRTVGIGKSSTKFGGKPGFSISVGVSPQGVQGKIPDEADNIPLTTHEQENIIPSGYCESVNIDKFDPIPGGVIVQNIAGTGTSAGRVKDEQSGDFKLLTAAHLIFNSWEGCSESPFEKEMDQNDDVIGKVDRYDRGADFALIKRTSDESYAAEVKEEGATRHSLMRRYTKDGIEDLKSSGRTVYKMGIATGKTNGQVEETEVSAQNVGVSDDCITWDGEGVKVSALSGTGDSGGPHYTVDHGLEGGALVSLQSASTSRFTESCNMDFDSDNETITIGGKSYGTGSYWLGNEYNINWLDNGGGI